MKPSNRNLTLLLISTLFMSSFCLSGQQKPIDVKIKNVSVYDEKYDKLVSKKSKDSETSYDQHGNIIEEIEYVNNKIDKHTQYQYDASDNKIKEIELDASGKTIKTTEYKYDKGMKIEKNVYGPDGKLKSKRTYIYTLY